MDKSNFEKSYKKTTESPRSRKSTAVSRLLRNKVNRERKTCRAKYYEAKVNYLKECKPSMWWKEVKKLSGMSSFSKDEDNVIKSLQLIEPSSNILNCSYFEACLPPSWKEADVVPVPKQKPIKDVNKHLHPISLTPILSKVAEEFVVEMYVKPVLMRKIGDNQFRSVPRSSTMQALISMLHTWLKYTDGNGTTVRVILFDYRKTFDLIDHSILAEKLKTLDLPNRIVCWIIDFLKSCKQWIKLAYDCKSEWCKLPASVWWPRTAIDIFTIFLKKI